MRVAFVGKGGAGKSSLAGTFARVLAETEHRVLALDSDPMPGLAYSLGLPSVDTGLPDEVVEEQCGPDDAAGEDALGEDEAAADSAGCEAVTAAGSMGWVWLVGLLGLKRRRITHHAAGGKGLAIHHSHHAAHARAGADLGPTKGLHQGHRQGQATGFHHDAVELISSLQQGLHRGQKFILHGAAKATIGELHHTPLQLLLRAEATAADQIAIDPHLTEFIHQHRQAQTTAHKQLAQQRGFSGT